jgi:hypothetical protein
MAPWQNPAPSVAAVDTDAVVATTEPADDFNPAYEFEVNLASALKTVTVKNRESRAIMTGWESVMP